MYGCGNNFNTKNLVSEPGKGVSQSPPMVGCVDALDKVAPDQTDKSSTPID